MDWPRCHPRMGLLFLSAADHERIWEQHRNGATDAEMAASLPTGIYSRTQYSRIVADWPARQAFLQARGQTDQLDREQLFITAMETINA